MKMGKLLYGVGCAVIAVVVGIVILQLNKPTLMAFEPPDVELSSIVLRTDGVKTSYLSGQFFDATGLVVEAVYTDRSRKDITAGWSYDAKPLTMNNPIVSISYTESGVTATANLGVTVTVMAGGEGFSDTTWWRAQDDGAIYRDNVLLGWKGEMPANYKLEILEGTRVIAEDAFYYYANLTAVTIPDGLIYIGAGAFRETGVTKFEIPNSVSFIGEKALAAAVNNTVEIGTGVVYDLEKSFDRSKTTKLEVAYYNENYATEGSVLFNKDRTVLIAALTNAPSIANLTAHPVKEIATAAFYNCTNITLLYLPTTLEKIGAAAFANCAGIISVSIPETVREIGAQAFDGCRALTTVYMVNDSNTPTIMGRGVFGGCTALTNVKVYNKVIPSITADVFPNNANLKIEISPRDNLATVVATVKAMPGWSIHASKIIPMP